MKCITYCTAEAYDLIKLKEQLTSKSITSHLYDNVLHISCEEDTWTHDIFFFDYGCCVIWAEGTLSDTLMHTLHTWLAAIAIKPLGEPIEDIIFYDYSEKTYVVEEEDTLFIENDSLIKLSMAHGLSQSAKLVAFEQAIIGTIHASRHLTDELAVRGKTSLSYKGLGKMIGQLFASRQFINLYTDILDTPEFFWRRPQYEPYYLSVVEFMDLNKRIDILNKRLDVIQELYEMLSNELKHEHSSRLELIIIALIMFEVMLALLTHFA